MVVDSPGDTGICFDQPMRDPLHVLKRATMVQTGQSEPKMIRSGPKKVEGKLGVAVETLRLLSVCE